jgi:8-oxo-dGTP pyrophosphatase MutT (NUDIX family)
VIRAAGGAVVRLRGGDVEVLLVHRQAYDDWTFPKGKALPDETDEACAVREVEEETGLTCALDTELPSTVYRDARDRRKRVRYWLMRPVGGRLAFDHEVDDGRWLTLADASGLLTYERDAAVLAAVEIAMPGSEALEKGAFAG